MRKAYQARAEGDQLRWRGDRKAIFGVRAPIGTHCEVKGAWIHKGKKFVTEDIKRRAERFQNYGFS